MVSRKKHASISIEDIQCKLKELEDDFNHLKRTNLVFLHALQLDDSQLQHILFECVSAWWECDIELIGTGIEDLKYFTVSKIRKDECTNGEDE